MSIELLDISSISLGLSLLILPVVSVSERELIIFSPSTLMPFGFAMTTSALLPATSKFPFRDDFSAEFTLLIIRLASLVSL